MSLAFDAPEMASVLLYVLYPSHARVMRRVGRMLVESGCHTPIAYFDQPPHPSDLEAMRAAGIACIDKGGAAITSIRAAAPTFRAGAGMARRAIDRVPSWLRTPIGDAVSLAGFVPRLVRDVRDLGETRQRFVRILREHDVRLVIAPGDNVGYATPALFAAAHDTGIRALVVPFTVSNRLEMVADLKRHRSYSLARLDNRALAALYPHWALRHDGHAMVRTPASHALALEWAGLAPKQPWVLNSGLADAIAVESDFMRDYYVRAGLDPTTFRMTGTLGDDDAAATLSDARARRAALCAELGFTGDRKLVLFSYGEYHHFFAMGGTAEFRSQSELTRFWLSALTGMRGFDVVISLHPSMPREAAGHLEASGARIATWPIETLIPLCDVYAVSISATVRTAIACGKPVVDHDVFAFDYDNFVGLPAVWIEKTRAGFAGTLSRLAQDETFYATAVAAQRELAPRFGTLDGKAAQRMRALVDELVEARRGS